MTKKILSVVLIAGSIIILMYWLALDSNAPTIATNDPPPPQSTATIISPAEGMIDKDRYTPGTETIGAGEIRITALGTGMPTPRPDQASACWLIELGNGDKFLFDIGSECYSHIVAQMIPLDELDKIFLTHLHVDHIGSLTSLWLTDNAMPRDKPLRVWGPSGPSPEYGTQYAMDNMKAMYRRELDRRTTRHDINGTALEVTEFDYRGLNSIVYQENGVVIRSVTAAHGFEGSVGYILEWNDLKVAYSGDTVPSQWWVDYSQGADISIHETLMPSLLLKERFGFTVLEALNVGTQGHTSPEQFGKVMSLTQPRMAVVFHTFNDTEVAPETRRRVQKTYGGSFAIAKDFMVFNVDKETIRVRMADVADTAASTMAPQITPSSHQLLETDRYVPGSEALASNEMRVIALGTDRPPTRPGQAADCWLVELGNGDKFLFDVGSECHSHIAAQKIAYDYLDKVFISQLDVLHSGDLASFWLGGTTMSRLTPLRIWGPSGTVSQYGTEFVMDSMHDMYTWDIYTRSGVIDARGMILDINEFDHRADNQVIYEENGVVIRSSGNSRDALGGVSYTLEWNGLKFAYSADDQINTTWVEDARHADIAVYKSSSPAGTDRPHFAVSSQHLVNSDVPGVVIPQDYMVFNVSNDAIRVRITEVDNDIWPQPAVREKQSEPDMLKLISLLTGYSRQAVLTMPEVVGPIYQEMNEQYGTDYEPITESFKLKALNKVMQIKRSADELFE